MGRNDFVRFFKEIGRDDASLVGGKCANLGELFRNVNVPVPNGFAVTAQAYAVFLEETGLTEGIDSLLADIDVGDMDALQSGSEKIREQIEKQPIPMRLKEAILEAYTTLSAEIGRKDVSVAVRSSATAEDLPGASFAGQHDTFLNVTRPTLLEHIQKCWSSVFTPRAIVYRREKGFSHLDVLVSVAVQEMVSSTASGVMFTIEPVTGQRDRLVINASWGLGEAIVGGQVTPDEFVVDKAKRSIIERSIFKKEKQILPHKKGAVAWVSVPESMREKPAVDDDIILKLAAYGLLIEKHYGVPQDIEWAVDADERIFILQARPETVHTAQSVSESERREDDVEGAILIRGLGVSPGRGSGPVKVILNIKDMSRFDEGEVLVTIMTMPDWIPAMKKASAIVTELGGKTSHAAIVSRELGVPAVVGCEDATKVLTDGQKVTVDGRKGIIYEGNHVTNYEGHTPPFRNTASPYTATATKVFVNLSIPELAERIARETGADGVGLLRAEHLMLSIGKHPRLLLEEGGGDMMVDTFSRGLVQVAEAFDPRPVVYRCLDFKPDEFLELQGGEKYERDHVGPNPMIGYRGQYRYLKEDDIFRLELRAVKRARELMGCINVNVMIPFVRTLSVFKETVQIMAEEGLDHVTDRDFQLWIMVEVPSACLMIEEFCREGIDGISIGTNDLTMLMLGADRNDKSVQDLYDERNLGVLRAIAYTLTVCRKHGVTTSICGQAPSVYPDYLEFMIRCGCTSLSVNPDAVVTAKQNVARIEKKIQMEKVLGKACRPKIGKIPLEEIFFWTSVEE